jgi:hypothetical protein
MLLKFSNLTHGQPIETLEFSILPNSFNSLLVYLTSLRFNMFKEVVETVSLLVLKFNFLNLFLITLKASKKLNN